MKKIETSQHFEILGASKLLEAPIFLRFKDSTRLRPLSTSEPWELQNTERPQLFWVQDSKKIEASQHFGTLGVAKH